ncbi:MAG TPA: response regulator, partial [Cyanothece sp. UBA12306]|nr:response regulator [Cyanothece sp. UBA12306]
MHGTLNEIDLCSILQLIELGQRSGGLLVEADLPWPSQGGRIQARLNNSGYLADVSPEFWLVFFVNGQIRPLAKV